jgi:hypothetical protein
MTSPCPATPPAVAPRNIPVRAFRRGHNSGCRLLFIRGAAWTGRQSCIGAEKPRRPLAREGVKPTRLVPPRPWRQWRRPVPPRADCSGQAIECHLPNWG